MGDVGRAPCPITANPYTVIGCTILRAVSGILRTHRGRCGSVLGRLPAGATRAGPDRPGRVGHFLLLPSLLACAASLLTCAASLLARVACLSLRVGVGQCSLAIGHGSTAGLIVGVLDRRLVSPLPSSRACSGAGSGWHGCGWITVSAVLSKGLAQWRRPLLVCCLLSRHRGGGLLAARGLAGHGDTGLSAACQLVSITAGAHLVKWQSARTGPPWAAGQVGRKAEPGASCLSRSRCLPRTRVIMTA
jgi:hypothetical protein